MCSLIWYTLCLIPLLFTTQHNNSYYHHQFPVYPSCEKFLNVVTCKTHSQTQPSSKVKQTRLQSKQNTRTKKQYWRLLFCSTAALIVQCRGQVKSFALLCRLQWNLGHIKTPQRCRWLLRTRSQNITARHFLCGSPRMDFM